VAAVLAYRRELEALGYSDWSIAESLRILKRGFKLGRAAGLVTTLPEIKIPWQCRRRSGTYHERTKRPPITMPELPEKVTTLADLRTLHVYDLMQNGRDPYDPWWRWEHLLKHFGDADPGTIRTVDVERYKRGRVLAGAKPSTLNNELAMLSRGYRLAAWFDLFEGTPPRIGKLRVDNARQGFLKPEEFRQLLQELEARNPAAADAVRFYYVLGWRKEEVLGLRWREVDRATGTIRLAAARVKTRRPRIAKLAGSLLEALERRWEARQGEYVFTHERWPGRRMRGFRGAWLAAVKAIGRPELRPHDCRRSMARNGILAGLHENRVMQIAGWATRHVFDRYNVQGEALIAEGVAALDAYAQTRTEAKAREA
jgi:integrase